MVGGKESLRAGSLLTITISYSVSPLTHNDLPLSLAPASAFLAAATDHQLILGAILS